MKPKSKQEFDLCADDKKLHFLMGAKIYFNCYKYIWKLSYLVVFIAAIGKETIDLLGYGTPEVADYKWTMYGAVTANQYVNNRKLFEEVYARK